MFQTVETPITRAAHLLDPRVQNYTLRPAGSRAALRTAGRLIEQQETGVDKQLVTHGGALALPAGDAFAEESAYDGVLAAVEPQRADDGVHARALVLLAHGARQAQLGRVPELRQKWSRRQGPLRREGGGVPTTGLRQE